MSSPYVSAVRIGKGRTRVAAAISDRQQIGWALFFLLIGLLLVAGHARADDDTDPFSLNKMEWKSLDRFQEEMKKSPPPVMPVTATAPETTQDEDSVKETATTAAAKALAPAPLTRPIHIPLLPSMNKGYDVHVTSTAESEAELTTPTRVLNEANWQRAEEIAQQGDGHAASIDGEDQPLNVRMSFLPDRAVAPVNSPEKVKPVRAAAVPDKPKAKTQAEAAACAAIDANKKRQLDAIQSDQKTLQALQAAIKELGLNKDLDFLTNTDINGSQTSTHIDTAPSLPGVRTN